MTGTVVAANAYATSDTAVNLYAETAAGNFVKHPKTKIANAEGLTTGQIHYASAANTLAALNIGTTGQALTVAGGIPSWAAFNDKMPLIQRQTFSAVASVNFTSGVTTAYDAFCFVLTDVFHSSSAQPLYIYGSTDGGSTYAVNFPSGAMIGVYGSTYNQRGWSTATPYVSYTGGGTLATSYNGVCFVSVSATSASYHSLLQSLDPTTPQISRAGGISTTASAVNAIRFAPPAGTITGTIAMYGIKNT